MKVKYWKSTNILSCYNINFELNLNVIVSKVGNECNILYDPLDIVHFIDRFFFVRSVSTSVQEYEHLLKVFLYQGCIYMIENKVFVNIYGLKHFFSSLVSSRVSANPASNKIELKHSKFILWALKYDFDQIIFKDIK